LVGPGDGHFELAIGLDNLIQSLFALGNVPYGLDGTDDSASGVVKLCGSTIEMSPTASVELRNKDISPKNITFAHDLVILLLDRLLRHEDEIDQNRLTLTIEGDGVFIVAFAEHLSLGNTGHFLDSLVPGEHLPLAVDHQGCIGQELDHIVQALVRLIQVVCRPLTLGDIPNHTPHEPGASFLCGNHIGLQLYRKDFTIPANVFLFVDPRITLSEQTALHNLFLLPDPPPFRG